jgi:hypothetical protein
MITVFEESRQCILWTASIRYALEMDIWCQITYALSLLNKQISIILLLTRLLMATSIVSENVRVAFVLGLVVDI